MSAADPPPAGPLAAVLLAGGAGTRFGGDKLFRPLGGRPVLDWSLRTFQEAPSVAFIVLVTGVANGERARRLVERGGYSKVRFRGAGGARRQDSAWNGLRLAAGAGWVILHDAARPFATPELVERCVAGARDSGGAIAAVPVKDTIKIVAHGLVEATPARSGLWAAQTPQVFRYDWLIDAYRRNGGADVTDDAELYERAGYPVAVVAGSYANLKITTPEDLALARAIARGARAGGAG